MKAALARVEAPNTAARKRTSAPVTTPGASCEFAVAGSTAGVPLPALLEVITVDAKSSPARIATAPCQPAQSTSTAVKGRNPVLARPPYTVTTARARKRDSGEWCARVTAANAGS